MKSNRINLIKLLDAYLEDRKAGTVSTEGYRRKIERLGKNEEQAQEILIEFDDEWTREEQNLFDLKRGKTNLVIGALVAVNAGVISIFSALNALFFNGVVIVLYGAVAYGLLLMIKGYNQHKMVHLKRKRRAIKWLSW